MDEITSFFRILYDKQDISHVLSEQLISISYSDYLSGQSDELSIELENSDQRWCDAWYPGHGDTLTLELGRDAKNSQTLGHFKIDEIEFKFSPSTVTIRALAVGVRSSVRTDNAQAYEKMTLNQVAERIAHRQNLTLVGAIEPIALDRLTQQESDIEFLNKLADEYDYAFKLRDDQLIFYAVALLEQQQPVAIFKLSDISDGHIRDQIKEVPSDVEVTSYDPATNKTIVLEIKNNTTQPAKSSKSQTTTSADTLKNSSRASSIEVADAKARAELLKANRQRTTASISLRGAVHFLSGNVIELQASGALNGCYLILSSQHNLNRSGGYVTSLELSRVRAPQQIKVKSGLSKQPVIYKVPQ